MYHVVTCTKLGRHSKTIRVVECPMIDMQKMLDADMGECLLCGPLSHVELGKRRDYWKVLSSHEMVDEATIAAWDIVDAGLTCSDLSWLEKVGTGRWYDSSKLSPRPVNQEA